MRASLFLIAIASIVGCHEDLGIDTARFACLSNGGCARDRFCDLVMRQCVTHGCGDGVTEDDEQCDVGPVPAPLDGCTNCKINFGAECSNPRGGPSVCSGRLFTDLALSDYHLCAVLAGGTLWCSGVDVDRFNRPGGQVSMAPRAGSFRRVTVGLTHSCALGADNLVTCWGSDIRFSNMFSSKQVSATPVEPRFELSTGGYHNCALTESSLVSCWGAGRYFQRNPGRFSSAPMRRLSLGYEHSCGIHLGTGQLMCWGQEDNNNPTMSREIIPGFEPLHSPPVGRAVELSSGWFYACAIMETGDIQCWGHLAAGDVLQPPSGQDFTEIACGHFHCCALHRDGRAECWGRDAQFGRLFSELTPDDEQLVKISSGPQYSCGIRPDSTAVCWGPIFQASADRDQIAAGP